MQIQIVSKGIDVSDALQEEISSRVEEGVAKYFNRPGEAYIAVSREGSGFRVTVSLHLPSGVMLQAQGEDGDAYKASDKAAEHLEKRLRRYKRKLKNHHNENKSDLPAETTPITVFQGQSGDDQHDDDETGVSEPVIVAETPGEMRAMTASMAVLELEAAGAPFMIFRNIAHNGVNIVYRRPDGHVGWIDPDRRK
jgi:ribosome hibernation promoting factor